ncbi:IS5 family transposase [Streptomyces mirabilis]|uniref:IS5 family transposase n=1 Tax=Streptomyces mirabilis TaxID=68239 RepID=UPI0036490D55
MGEPRARYLTDLSDAEWEILRPLVPAVKPGGRSARHTRREIVNALAYWLRAGCAWRLLPHDLPTCQTTYHYWWQFQRDGLWEGLLTELREGERLRLGRDPTPGAGIMDSQSVRATERGGLLGYDGGKKANGIKRHLLVDTLGTVLLACVRPPNVDDRNGAEVLLCQAADNFPRLKHIWAHQGYRGADFHAWIRQASGITVQIVRRRDGGFRRTWAKAGAPFPEVPYFAVVQRRWVVERRFAWLGRCRRLSKDYEYLRGNSENFICLAIAMLLLRRHARAPR